MSCGYVCPVCEGSGYLENGGDCDYCQKPKTGKPSGKNYFFEISSMRSFPWRSFLKLKLIGWQPKILVKASF